ncbi:hypothetical protein COOONC_18766, partial [Cooperia oncophora]
KGEGGSVVTATSTAPTKAPTTEGSVAESTETDNSSLPDAVTFKSAELENNINVVARSPALEGRKESLRKTLEKSDMGDTKNEGDDQPKKDGHDAQDIKPLDKADVPAPTVDEAAKKTPAPINQPKGDEEELVVNGLSKAPDLHFFQLPFLRVKMV